MIPDYYCSLNSKAIPSYCNTCTYGCLKCVFRHKDFGVAKKHASADKKVKDRQISKLDEIIAVQKACLERYPRIFHEKTDPEYTERISFFEDGLLAQIFICLGISILLGFPLAYFGQIFQILSDAFFSFLGIIFDLSDPIKDLSTPKEEQFFYSSFWSRYIYWTSLVLAIAGWVASDKGSKYETEAKTTFAWIVTIIYFIVAIMNFNLLISTVFGPIVLIFGIAATSKK